MCVDMAGMRWMEICTSWLSDWLPMLHYSRPVGITTSPDLCLFATRQLVRMPSRVCESVGNRDQWSHSDGKEGGLHHAPTCGHEHSKLHISVLARPAQLTPQSHLNHGCLSQGLGSSHPGQCSANDAVTARVHVSEPCGIG